MLKKKRIIPIIAGLAIIIIIATIIIPIIANKSNSAKIVTSSQLEKAVNISDLSTAEFVYNGIAEKYKDDNPEKEKYNIKYDASVKVGINMNDIDFNFTAPVHVLKADGGTLPLDIALKQPVETIFTGPAASVLGIEALGAPQVKSISLDVGGTTTDIAFWENGLPLLAGHGAKVAGYPTAVRSFHMRSVGIGGDSRIRRTETGFEVGPERIGPAMAVGGCEPTLSDALIVAGRVGFGDKAAAHKGMQQLCLMGETAAEVAMQVVEAAVSVIEATINEMLHEWSIQPVYTVNDVIKGTEFEPELLVGVGGGAAGLIMALGERMGLPVEIPAGATVANAVGAALARPTLAASLRADTTEGYYLIPESGQRERLPSGFSMKMAEELLAAWLHEQAKAWQLPGQEAEVISKEFFRTIHGYYDSGEIISLRMQLKPGILQTVIGREVAF